MVDVFGGSKEQIAKPVEDKPQEQVQVYYKEFSRTELQKAMNYYEERRKKAVQLVIMLLPVTFASILMLYFKITRGWIPDYLIIASLLLCIGTGITVGYVMYLWFISSLIKREE